MIYVLFAAQSVPEDRACLAETLDRLWLCAVHACRNGNCEERLTFYRPRHSSERAAEGSLLIVLKVWSGGTQRRTGNR